MKRKSFLAVLDANLLEICDSIYEGLEMVVESVADFVTDILFNAEARWSQIVCDCESPLCRSWMYRYLTNLDGHSKITNQKPRNGAEVVENRLVSE
jgi:hypothetical protein